MEGCAGCPLVALRMRTAAKNQTKTKQSSAEVFVSVTNCCLGLL